VLPSSFAVGLAAQTSIAATGLAAAALWQQRGGAPQRVAVDMRHAGVEFRSERYLRIDGQPAPEAWDPIAGLYPTGDGGWVRLHTNFPHHRDGILHLLGCAYNRQAVTDALRGWQAEAFEAAAASAGLCVTALRDFTQWDAHPQGRAIPPHPLSIEKIGDAPARALSPGADRPLSGVRVLDLTRVIAGPLAGRTLAAHGADVLLVTAAHLPSIPPLVIDTGRGKRNTALDLRTPEGKAALHALLRDADIFLQGYRPGGLAALGFGPEELAARYPGLVCVSLSAYGHAGPWADRRGFDSLTQTASGLNVAEAQAAGADTPRALPAQVLDHASGYLLAFGAMAALHRRATEGGSWLVRVSLAATGRWLRELGRVPDGFACPDPGIEDVADLLERTPSGFGELTAVRHAAILSETPARWALPSVPLGTHPPEWANGQRS
jgi:crotonobetainyl-CoA:carnitine CoA-transferase CaiB-like acyl-CoA transferase